MSPIVVIVIALLGSYLLSRLAHRIGLPSVVGNIGAGIILGTPALASFINQETTNVFMFLANIGIILLFYYVGLETRFKGMKKQIEQSILISLLNTTVPFALGYVLLHYEFGLEILPCVVLATAISVSAHALPLGLLEELGLLKSRIGKLLIFDGAVDDIIELFLISGVLSLIQFAGSTINISLLLLNMAIFLGVVLIGRFLIIPHLWKLFDSQESSTSHFAGSIIIALLIASIADLLNVGIVIGALIAGVISRQVIYKDATHRPLHEEHDVARSIHTIGFGFLIPIFFVWIGLNTQLGSIAEVPGLVSLLVLIGIAGCVAGTTLAVRLTHGNWRDGVILGFGMTSKGDTDLVIAALALNAGVITQPLFTALVVTSVLITVLSLVVFKALLTNVKNRGLKTAS